MSATADVTQPERVSFSSSLPRHTAAQSRSRQAGNTQAATQDVVHNDLTSQRLAHEAALGHALMNPGDPNVQNQIHQQQSLAMQQAVAQIAKMPPQFEEFAMQNIRMQLVLQDLGNRMQGEKFRKERAKRDARYVTDELHGRAPGKSIESADTGGASIA